MLPNAGESSSFSSHPLISDICSDSSPESTSLSPKDDDVTKPQVSDDVEEDEQQAEEVSVCDAIVVAVVTSSNYRKMSVQVKVEKIKAKKLLPRDVEDARSEKILKKLSLNYLITMTTKVSVFCFTCPR